MMNPLVQHDLEDETTTKPTFQVTDISSATWAMRKLKASVEQDEELKKAAQAQIQDIQDWLDNKLKANEDSRSYLKGLVTDYLFKEREQDPKFRVETPYGTVSTRKNPAGVLWSDAKVLGSLKDQGLTDLIITEEKPDKKAIKKAFSFQNGKYVNEDGQVLEGTSEKESTIKVNFKFN